MASSENDRVTLAVLKRDLEHVHEDLSKRLDAVCRKLDNQNGIVRGHETRITVMETFCLEQVKPALNQIVENRVEIATTAAKWGAGGAGAGVGLGAVLFGIARAAGWV